MATIGLGMADGSGMGRTIALLCAAVQEKTLRRHSICDIFLHMSEKEPCMLRAALIATFLFVLPYGEAGAEFYKWVDKDGREFVTNDREKIPPEHRNSATAVPLDEKRVSVGQQPAASGKQSPAVREHRDRYGKGEEHWRKRASKLRRELAALQDRHDLLLKQERDEDRVRDGRPARSSKKKKPALRKKIEQLEREITGKKRELEVDLPEEARKADAYPGWIRE